MNLSRWMIWTAAALVWLGGLTGTSTQAHAWELGEHAAPPSMAGPPGKKQNVAAKKKPKAGAKQTSAKKYKVGPGDSLNSIARKFGVSVKQIQGWNNLNGTMINPGKTLVIHSHKNVKAKAQHKHRVKKGETPAQIAQKYGIKTGDLLNWNPRLDPRALRPGETVVIWGEDDEESDTESTGTANRGRLKGSIALQDGLGYRVRATDRSYGTRTTVRLIEECIGNTRQKHKDAPDIMIGDLSFEKGGKMRPHKSHQSGRDADIAYYIKGQDTAWRFYVAKPSNLDVAKTWTLFKEFVETNKVEYIFVDYNLQKVLYEYGRKHGASAEYLDRVFQYPKGKSSQQGIIRWSRGHDDHFHIRFKCDDDDPKCAD